MTLACRNLTRKFGGITAVDDVSTTFEAGTIHGLIGPNGAGKTTFFDLLTGFISPDRGTVEFNDVDITDHPINKRAKAGLVRTFQDTRVFEGLTLLENLYVATDHDNRTLLGGDPQEETTERAWELLEIVELEELGDEKAAELSYGQQKLLDFATGLMREPDVLLLDEPVAGINPSLIRDIERFILNVREEGTTPIIVEHNMDFAMRLCDEIHVLHQGSIIAHGTPAEVRADQQVLDAYLGGEQA